MKNTVEFSRTTTITLEHAQYSRQECVAVISIPSSVEHDQLEFSTTGNQIEATHRLVKNSDRVILRFSVTVSIRLQEMVPQSIVTSLEDLKELFPDQDFTVF